MRTRPAIIVTAAGLGSRFGGAVHKLDQPFDGATVLATTVRHAVQTNLSVVVVTTAARAAALTGHVAPQDIVVLTEAQAARGMGASIATGVVERSGAPGWLVLPGDMPLVQPGTMLAVAGALEQHPVAYAQYRGRRGHPVAFAAELYSELTQLSGDDGARRVMLRYPAHGQEVEDPGVLLDIDTPGDLEALRRAHAQVARVKAEDA
jgi:molybdenum cofactor cytidylyltransferase